MPAGPAPDDGVAREQLYFDEVAALTPQWAKLMEAFNREHKAALETMGNADAATTAAMTKETGNGKLAKSLGTHLAQNELTEIADARAEIAVLLEQRGADFAIMEQGSAKIMGAMSAARRRKLEIVAGRKGDEVDEAKEAYAKAIKGAGKTGALVAEATTDLLQGVMLPSTIPGTVFKWMGKGLAELFGGGVSPAVKARHSATITALKRDLQGIRSSQVRAIDSEMTAQILEGEQRMREGRQKLRATDAAIAKATQRVFNNIGDLATISGKRGHAKTPGLIKNQLDTAIGAPQGFLAAAEAAMDFLKNAKPFKELSNRLTSARVAVNLIATDMRFARTERERAQALEMLQRWQRAVGQLHDLADWHSEARILLKSEMNTVGSNGQVKVVLEHLDVLMDQAKKYQFASK